MFSYLENKFWTKKLAQGGASARADVASEAKDIEEGARETIFTAVWKTRLKNDPERKFQGVKLHISLSQEDYNNHYIAISNILNRYLINNTIHLFMRVNPFALQEELAFLARMEPHQSGIIPPAEIQKIKESPERFRKGDQFTIYIPQNAEPQNIEAMCRAINSFMTENNITSQGNTSDVTLPITDQINAELEYFPDEEEPRQGIDAIKDPDETLERRFKAKECLKENPMYVHLKNAFSPNNQSDFNASQPPDQSDITISCSWLIDFLSHPATLPVFLIIVGALGLVFGGLGLEGIVTELTVLDSQIMTGVALGTTLAGSGLGLYRLFSAPKEEKEEPVSLRVDPK